MNERVTKPVPVPNVLSAPYWQGLNDGQLLLQACAVCGVLRHYPRLLCTACFSAEVRWQAASGRGQIHSWTVAHHAFHAGFAADLPYTLVTVDLEEGPRALGRWLGDTPHIGLAVHTRIERGGEAAELCFEPDGRD